MARKNKYSKSLTEFLKLYRETYGDKSFTAESWKVVFEEEGKEDTTLSELPDEQLLVIAFWDAVAREQEARKLYLELVEQVSASLQKPANRATRRATKR